MHQLKLIPLMPHLDERIFLRKGLPPQVDDQIFIKEIDLESGKTFLKASTFCAVCKHQIIIVQEIRDE